MGISNSALYRNSAHYFKLACGLLERRLKPLCVSSWPLKVGFDFTRHSFQNLLRGPRGHTFLFWRGKLRDLRGVICGRDAWELSKSRCLWHPSVRRGNSCHIRCDIRSQLVKKPLDETLYRSKVIVSPERATWLLQWHNTLLTDLVYDWSHWGGEGGRRRGQINWLLTFTIEWWRNTANPAAHAYVIARG